MKYEENNFGNFNFVNHFFLDFLRSNEIEQNGKYFRTVLDDIFAKINFIFFGIDFLSWMKIISWMGIIFYDKF